MGDNKYLTVVSHNMLGGDMARLREGEQYLIVGTLGYHRSC